MTVAMSLPMAAAIAVTIATSMCDIESDNVSNNGCGTEYKNGNKKTMQYLPSVLSFPVTHSVCKLYNGHIWTFSMGYTRPAFRI